MQRNLPGRLAVTAVFATLFLACRIGMAQDLKSFEQRITTKVLPNGLTILICERPEAPVFSYSTFVDAGDVNDPSGESGLAHMFEHLAFKGTNEIGTTDYAAEKVALAKVEAANDAYRGRVSASPMGRDPKKLDELKKAFDAAQAERRKICRFRTSSPKWRSAMARTSLNAETGLDETMYFWSMPENRLELWAWLESGRLADTVPREFYKERDVVMEERRMRTDSNPDGPAAGAARGHCICRAQLRTQRRGLAERSWPDHGDRGDGLPQEVLRGIEHRGCRGGRRQGCRGDAHAGEIFQQGSRRPEAAKK